MSDVLDRYQNGRYRNANPDWHAEDAPWKAASLISFLDGVGWDPQSFLDAGCGSGAVLQALKDGYDGRNALDKRYAGWDISRDALGDALPTERLEYFVGDVGDMEVHADVVLCMDVVEHVPDDHRFLHQLRNHGDRFVFRIPLDLSAWDAARPARLLEARERWGHLHAYNRALATKLLEDCGYRIVSTRYDRVPPARRTWRQWIADLGRLTAYQVAPDLTVDLIGGWSMLVAAVPADGALAST